MKKESTDLIELIGEFLVSGHSQVVAKTTREAEPIEIEEKRIVFNFETEQVIYDACQHMADKQSAELLYNILKLHLKSKDVMAQRDENCLSTVTNHELKNILSSAQLSLEMLNTYDFEREDRSRLLIQAFEAVSQSVSLFDEMIMIEKLQHQQRNKNITIEMVDVVPIVEAVIETLSPNIASKNLTVSLHDKTEGTFINASAFWVERALFNLISNAVKYNEDNGTLTIDMINEKKAIVIHVHDSGVGIETSEQGSVLEKFQTTDATQNQGTGVGLALVKAIADAHTGALDFESVHGEGSTFSITFPKKIANKQIRHPLAVMNAASILLLVGLSYFFPVIPTFDTVETVGEYESIKLEDGSRIKIQKGDDYSFWHLQNLTGSKAYMRLTLDGGKAEADLRGSKVNFVTPTLSFVNLGTELAFEQQQGRSTVSVYKGEVQAEKIHLGKGEGLVSSENGIEVTELLNAPYGIVFEADENGSVSLHFDAVEGAETYHVVLAKDEDFTEAISIQERSKRAYLFSIKEDGYYYVKIAAIDKNGIMGFANTGVIKSTYNLKQGVLLRKNGQYDEADTFFKKSEKSFEKKDYEPYSEMAFNSYLQGNFAQAVRIYEEALAINETEEDQINLARSYYYLKAYDKAVFIYETLLQDDGENEKAMWGLAEVYIATKEYRKAKKTLKSLFDLNPDYPLAYYDMARVMFLTKHKKEGFSYIDKALLSSREHDPFEIANRAVDADDPEALKAFFIDNIYFHTQGQRAYIEQEVALMLKKAFSEN